VVEGARLERGYRATYLGFESLAVHHLKTNSPNISDSSNTTYSKSSIQTNYDTFGKKCDTNVYKVKDTFYFRKRINKKLYRISLRTKNLKVAMKRKKLFKMMSKEELLHTLKFGDYEYIFEYDNEEEFERRKKDVLQTHKEILEFETSLQTEKKAYNKAHELLEKFATRDEKGHPLTWFELEAKFIQEKKELGKVSATTYKAYASTFKKLQEYFEKRKIDEISIGDYKAFRNFLKSLEIKNKTINNHIAYVNLFLEFAVKNKLIKENNVIALESLKEEKVDKVNYTNEEVNEILEYDYEDNVAVTFAILAFSGMRIDEIHNLTNDDIKDENGIKYFQIRDGKTDNAIRQVPIHKKIAKFVKRTDFPLFKDKTSGAMQKKMLRELYKVIPKGQTKTIHTFRATFIEKALNNNPDKLHVIQEVVGHSKTKSASLTIDTYAKGFALDLKVPIVNSVFY